MSNNSKMVPDSAIFTIVNMALSGTIFELFDIRKSIARRCFQWSWTTPNPVFKVTLLFDAEYHERLKIRP